MSWFTLAAVGAPSATGTLCQCPRGKSAEAEGVVGHLRGQLVIPKAREQKEQGQTSRGAPRRPHTDISPAPQKLDRVSVWAVVLVLGEKMMVMVVIKLLPVLHAGSDLGAGSWCSGTWSSAALEPWAVRRRGAGGRGVGGGEPAGDVPGFTRRAEWWRVACERRRGQLGAWPLRE